MLRQIQEAWSNKDQNLRQRKGEIIGNKHIQEEK